LARLIEDTRGIGLTMVNLGWVELLEGNLGRAVACFEEAEQADCMIVAGTSATVFPAAQFPISIHQRGGDLIEVNPYESEITALCRHAMRGPAGELLPRLVERVRARF